MEIQIRLILVSLLFSGFAISLYYFMVEEQTDLFVVVIFFMFTSYYFYPTATKEKHYILEIKQNPIIKVESISKFDIKNEKGIFTATYEETKGNYKTITFSNDFTINETEKEEKK